MRKIKKRVECGCGKVQMLVSIEKIPEWIKENEFADLERVYYCKHCETYAVTNLSNKQIADRKR